MDRLYLDDAPDTLEQILADAAPCREKTPADLPRSSDQLYVELFTSPLFLHKHAERRVSLYELFIPQRFDMDGRLAEFIRDERGPQFLIIEGDAGCGKTSLTAYLCYHFQQQDEISQKIFGDRRMTAIRLRDLEIPREGKASERLLLGILRQLWQDAETDRERMKRFQDEDTGPQVLFLDGYDELCTIDGMEDPCAALGGLRALGCKIIVTIRPKYLRFQDFRERYDHIALDHLNKDQRRAWLDRYTTICGQALNQERRDYLENIEDGGICDTPLGLYMVAAGRFPSEALKNEWALYHQIFFQELSDTDYNQIARMSGDLSPEHPVRDYREALYQVSEEIAWYLYQNGNEDLLVSMEKVREIDNNDELFLKMIKAPALNENSLASKYMRDGYADDFLRNIFDQDPKDAIRRNMVYVGLKYQARALSAGRFHNTMDLIRRPIHYIKKTAVQKKTSGKK